MAKRETRIKASEIRRLYDIAYRRARRKLGKFTKPALNIVDAPASDLGTLGYYEHSDNSIEVNKNHVCKRQLIDTLRHELIHAFLHEQACTHVKLFKEHAVKIGALVDY